MTVRQARSLGLTRVVHEYRLWLSADGLGNDGDVIVSGPRLGFRMIDGLSPTGKGGQLCGFEECLHIAEHRTRIDPAGSHAAITAGDFHLSFEFVFHGREVLVEVRIEKV